MEWREDDCIPLDAETMENSIVHQTTICKGVSMMCSKENDQQEFVKQGLEMKKYMHEFLKKINQYYEEMRGKD